MAAEAPTTPAERAPAEGDAPVPAAAGREAWGVEPWTSFAAWAADELQCRLVYDGSSYRIEDPLAPPAATASENDSAVRRSWFRRRAAADARPSAPRPAPFAGASPAELIDELLRRLRERDAPVSARPIEQPEAVHELSARLFSAYRLDGGRAHLAGCHLEDVPLVRLTTVEEDPVGDAPRVTHRVLDELGRPVSWPMVRELGVDRVAPLPGAASRIDAGRLARMLESAQRAAESEGVGAVALETIVWAKRAEGRLRFEFGEESIDAEFAGWARRLSAPAVVCPATGVETFHLATADDGRVAAAESLAVSAVTGRRLVLSDLHRCEATGGLAEAEHVARCAATGRPTLRTHLAPCARCGLGVGPAARRGPTGCVVCAATRPVPPNDPRVAAVRDRHGALAGGTWRLAETPTAWVLASSGWLRRRIVAIDRETLAVIHAAEASRFSAVWRAISLDALR